MMKKASLILAAALAVMAAGCSQQDIDQMQAEKIESYDLTTNQKRIAELYLSGYKKAVGRNMLKSSEMGHIICYAKTVDMPPRLRRAHEAYLPDYMGFDDDFYGRFKKLGIDDQAAYDMYEHFEKAFDGCTVSGMLKKRRG